MSDLQMRLDRLADRASTSDDAFERLARRRRIRHRRHRLTAGMLALAVAAGGSLTVFKVFGGSEERLTRQRVAGAILDPALRFDITPGATLRHGQSVTLHVSLRT